MSQLSDLEEGIKNSINDFSKNGQKNDIFPTKKRKPIKESPSAKRWQPTEKVLHRITLRVQYKQLGGFELFTYESTKMSRIDAFFEAKKAAKEAGYPIVTVVDDWVSF